MFEVFLPHGSKLQKFYCHQTNVHVDVISLFRHTAYAFCQLNECLTLMASGSDPTESEIPEYEIMLEFSH